MKRPAIKNMKPKTSFYKSGQYDSRDFKKVFESCKNMPTIYRSGLELQFIIFCENNPGILHWGSEPVEIPYISRMDNKEHKYYPDFIIENYKHERIIVEIKPYDLTIKPGPSSSLWAKEQWVKNNDKWTFAKKFAEDHNMKFMIVTERFFR